eukprot:CAMPEP_0196591718 /NCGR_PEP_ID=MMETSP1081-20130531/70682_1 /TAXON_ID=36882 /ORGANISM="Pyramimonas amylifera, Strain CCMP720" /LENGTH=226 /DNA_ID=CAMNT_0041915177 /DNA_START=336 /DNA_END=1016 /DNA_ORIENTATION=-
MDCSALATRFHDGTKLLFVSDPDVPGRIVKDVPSEVACEAKTREWIKKVPASFAIPNMSDPDFQFGMKPEQISQHIYSLRSDCKKYFPELHVEQIPLSPPPPPPPFSLAIPVAIVNISRTQDPATFPVFDCTSDAPMPGWAMAECTYKREGVNGTSVTIDQYIAKKGIKGTSKDAGRTRNLPLARGGGAQESYPPPSPPYSPRNATMVSSGGLRGRKFPRPVEIQS